VGRGGGLNRIEKPPMAILTNFFARDALLSQAGEKLRVVVIHPVRWSFPNSGTNRRIAQKGTGRPSVEIRVELHALKAIHEADHKTGRLN